MPARKTTAQKKPPRAPSTAAPPRPAAASRGAPPAQTIITGNLQAAADFVGRDKITNVYNSTPADLDQLIHKVLELLEAGAVFVPYGDQRDGYRTELDGEALSFRPGAIQRLTSGRRRSERTFLLGLVVSQRYSRWATDFVPLEALADLRQDEMDLPRRYELTEPPPPGAGPDAQPRREELPVVLADGGDAALLEHLGDERLVLDQPATALLGA